MQYESNPANGFRDIVWKQNTDTQTHAARPDMMMTISPPLRRGRGIKRNMLEGFYNFKHKHCPRLVIFAIEYFDLMSLPKCNE